MVKADRLSCKRLYEFYRELENRGIENHSLIIMQNGETLFEEYAAPYSADMPHTMFSVTKSIVATAAGFAIEEGLFSLDSKILPIFSEYEHCESEQWEETTVRSVLTMQSNKEFSFLQDMTGDYVEIFMKAPFRKNKGFLYSNNDAHMVAAIIQKLSGENLVDYLMPRLFEPLGIERPFWETNEKGECIGGTGVYLKLRDVAKICQCYADSGRYNGRQIIPEWWTREATRLQVDFDGKGKNGYGYLFWLEGGCVCMSGMFGQFAGYFPQYDAVAVGFNCVVDDNKNTSLMENELMKVFEGPDGGGWEEKLSDYLASRGEKPVICDGIPDIPTGRVFRLTAFSDIIAKLMFPASLIPRSLTSSFARRPKKNLDRVSFEIVDGALEIKWYEEEDEVIIKSGLDGVPRTSCCSIKGYPYTVRSYAYMQGGKLRAVIKPLNTLATQYATFDFAKDTVKIQLKGTPSFPEFICRNANHSDIIRNHPKLRPVMMKGLNFVLSTTEMPMKFRAVK